MASLTTRIDRVQTRSNLAIFVDNMLLKLRMTLSITHCETSILWIMTMKIMLLTIIMTPFFAGIQITAIAIAIAILLTTTNHRQQNANCKLLIDNIDETCMSYMQ